MLKGDQNLNSEVASYSQDVLQKMSFRLATKSLLFQISSLSNRFAVYMPWSSE